MIPRYQRIVFWLLLVCITGMSLFLVRGCSEARKKLTALADATPIAAPASTTRPEEVTLELASDVDDSITPTQRTLALPQDQPLRLRNILQALLAEYALPTSAHVLPAEPAVIDVFLIPLSAMDNDQPQSPLQAASAVSDTTPLLAVVNLRSSFVLHHPSGVQSEDLTLQSIVGTLHAASPQIARVRFLVDGQPHDTLAGHISLTRTYPAVDTAYAPALPNASPQDAAR
ncbi:MAG: GerMN domain-containing protein [Acidobacteriota bacterium]|nr:GerMN domain-containing protein [Acidobacteriota bacterium]